MSLSVTKLFENDRVIVSDIVLPAGGERILFQHPYNSIRWQVGEAVHQKNENKPAKIPDKDVLFIEKGTKFQLLNVSPVKESRHILFELKKEPKHTEKEVVEILARAVYPTNVGTSLLFENR